MYPGMLAPALTLEYGEALLSGLVFVTAFAHRFGGARITGNAWADSFAWLAVAVVAVFPHALGLVMGPLALFALMALSRRRFPAMRIA